ncbi:glycoside hydrolase family 9 protein [Clostridium cellulovorans]|uniref:Glycoside hydrolase family 9 n=1 Tax=Clostridium cellulovorans (strain ATCC 35296 / DSM 3052 / OCM 3 / 743B) TaxID=573061 RepID=D9SW83_CLOC7|nr:glycoside hydrolase family 9 protein [Clostridium cellulovorans]ADL51227.1 glycoside hydrolase family 9 [Clostridium cellulovorans 743B]
MRKKFITALIAGAVLFGGFGSYQAAAADMTVNLIENGSLDTNAKGWGGFTTEGGGGYLTYDDGGIKAEVTNCGNAPYSIQIYKDDFKMYKNGKYHLEFDVSSTVDRTIQYTIQLNRGDYRYYVEDKINTTQEVKTVSQDFVMTEETDMIPRLAFNVGNVVGENLGNHSVKIDNVKLFLVDVSGIKEEIESPKVEQKIVLNQIGYKPEDKKKVVFRTETNDRNFRVVSTKTNEVVYQGDIYGRTYNETAGEINSFGDLSSLKTPGTYRIETDSFGSSYQFTIAEDVYKNLFKDAMRFFYFQRCGQELTQDFAGTWAHPACHQQLATIYGTDQKIDVSGGWHDAGDYGRYVIANSKAMADLFTAYNDNKAAFGDDFNIPESGNGIPDVLDELKYQLEWMLKMQEKTSGGVYHKVTSWDFPGYVMPQEETGELLVCPISTPATADFAAIMAMGYENFKDIDPALASTCLAAGEKAWAYLEKTPNTPFSNPPGVLTGDYADGYDGDERYWAAAQLFKATGDSKYDQAFRTMLNTKYESGFLWSNVGHYGNLAYIAAAGADQNAAGNIKNRIIDEAQDIVAFSRNDGYNSSTPSYFYYWGSNAKMNNNAMLLANAYKISNNPEFLEYAKEHVNYCLGKNSLGKCFITGYGTDGVETPHHRPSMAQGKALPGMIVGGPNKYLEDPTMKLGLTEEAPARCYLDDSECFACNEVDINWNSPLICAMSELNMK